MNNEPFIAPFAKIEWAKTEIQKLNIEVGRIMNAEPKIMASNLNPNGYDVWRYRPPLIPANTNVTVGAIVNNLRAPLDQMLSEIAVQCSGSFEGVSFPFGENTVKFEASLAKQKMLPADAHAMIRELRPFRGGNDLLYALHRALDVPNKHHPGLIAINTKVHTLMSTLITWNGPVLSYGPRTGRHFVLAANGDFVQEITAKQPGMVLGNDGGAVFVGITNRQFDGTVPRFYNQTGKAPHIDVPFYISKITLPLIAAQDDMEIATAPPGTQFQVEAEPSFDIAFRDVEGFRREPVAAVLRQMCHLAESILLTFKHRFFPSSK